MLDAAARNREDDSLLFLFVGNGADCERIERRAADLDLRNARFLPLLSDADFRGLLAASGVCLVTQQKSVSEIAFPSKVVTYMAAGRPMVASVNSGSEVARTIRESQAGKVAEPENPRALLEAIRELRAEDLRKVGENARAYARRRWSAERVLGHMEQTLMAIAGAGRSPLAKEGACE